MCPKVMLMHTPYLRHYLDRDRSFTLTVMGLFLLASLHCDHFKIEAALLGAVAWGSCRVALVGRTSSTPSPRLTTDAYYGRSPGQPKPEATGVAGGGEAQSAFSSVLAICRANGGRCSVPPSSMN